MSDRFKYIKFEELMASIRSDLHLYDNNDFILNDRLLKVIYRCNEKLGVKLNKSKQCLIEVKNGKADLPKDFYKIEMVFATYVTPVPANMQLIPGNKAEYTTCPVKSNDPMIRIDKIGCKDVCCNEMYIVRQPQIQREIYIKSFIALNMSTNCTNKCTSYTPGLQKVNSEYEIDLTDDLIKTNFKDGQLFLSYLGTLEDEDGTPMIPFHPLLNDYYEWSIKRKIFEDIFLNSEADVEKKLQYAKQEQGMAYVEAWQFTGYQEHQELEKYYQKSSMDFYNKWFKIYE